jgi:hypothetical protein
MIDRLVALIVDEGKWLTLSMSLAGVGIALLIFRQRASTLPVRQRITAAMNLGAGLTIGSMAFGHLLAVATKLALGTLREGSLPIFLAIGLGLLIPSWMVTRHTRELLHANDETRRTTVLLNAWLAITLLALGLHNLPLAAPALFTIAYRVHSGRLMGWAIASLAVAFNVSLFAASLVFLASGQSFEQFFGIEARASSSVAQHPGHVLVLPDSTTWGPASPKLAPGAQFAKVMGDPSKVGEPYVFRAKLPDGYSVPPHWHPMDENVTVITGVFRLGFGTRIDPADMRDLPAGSYALLPKDVPHYNIMKGETILQFHGIGPYDINYVNPADAPSGRSMAK